MRGIVAGIGALFGLLVCGGIALAAIADGESPSSRAALLEKQDFVQEIIRGGGVQENAPVILARRRRRRRKKKSSSSYVSTGGGSSIQVDPNTAEMKKLLMLPLLSREEAKAIIEYRKRDRIDTIEEILEIDGVKPSHYRIFKHLIVIREGGATEMEAATMVPQLQ
jgi:DNA uptake protein ComE-like DNA-binding protein